MYVIDTNIFLRVLVKEDEKAFNSCFALLEAIKKNQLSACIPSMVLPEIVWTLQSYYDFPKPKVIAAVRGILNLRGLKVVEGYDHATALDFYQSKSVKYIDACIASLSEIQEDGAIVISYDHDFDKIGVKREEPDQVLKS